jgi:hypothetical protein
VLSRKGSGNDQVIGFGCRKGGVQDVVSVSRNGPPLPGMGACKVCRPIAAAAKGQCRGGTDGGRAPYETQ